MYIDYGHTQMCVLPDDTSFWCRDAYDVEMVKPGARVFHILSMLLKILVLIPRRRLVLTPHVFLIKDKFSLLYQVFCVFKCLFIQPDCHWSYLLFQSQSKRNLFSAVSISPIIK